MRSLALLGSGAIAACSGGPSAPIAEQASDPPRTAKRAPPPPPLGLVEGTVWRFRGTHVSVDDASGTERTEVITWQTEVIADERDGDRRRWRIRGWPADAVGWDATPPPVAETTLVLDDDVLYLGGDRATPSRDDAWLRWPPEDGDEVCLPDGGSYCWTVEASGQAPKTYEVTLRTGPDFTRYTLDVRRGVVRFEYHHNGTTNDVVLERAP